MKSFLKVYTDYGAHDMEYVHGYFSCEDKVKAMALLQEVINNDSKNCDIQCIDEIEFGKDGITTTKASFLVTQNYLINPDEIHISGDWANEIIIPDSIKHLKVVYGTY